MKILLKILVAPFALAWRDCKLSSQRPTGR